MVIMMMMMSMHFTLCIRTSLLEQRLYAQCNELSLKRIRFWCVPQLPALMCFFCTNHSHQRMRKRGSEWNNQKSRETIQITIFEREKCYAICTLIRSIEFSSKWDGSGSSTYIHTNVNGSLFVQLKCDPFFTCSTEDIAGECRIKIALRICREKSALHPKNIECQTKEE